jgi:hypothetical protein
MTTETTPRSSLPVVLSLGMGVDSAAILARWLLDPTSRDFDLSQLVVITAQVGDEFPDTATLMDAYLLPLMREHNVRWVQVARERYDGTYVVLEDSCQPTRTYLEGCYKLSDEMKAAGTIPTSGMARKCSMHAKGWPLDRWLADEFGDRPFRHVMGFNDDEHRRVEKDSSFSGEQRRSEYPLLDWHWGRKACEDYLRETFGVEWRKSCCMYCPFACNKKGIADHLERWRRFPKGAALAMWIEHAALALNVRMPLFAKNGTARSFVENDGNDDAMTELAGCFGECDEREEWALYHVRRVFSDKSHAVRSVEVEIVGSHTEAREALFELAEQTGRAVVDEAGSERVWMAQKSDSFPCIEDQYVVAPLVADEKENKSFAKKWFDVAAQLSSCMAA